MSDSGQHRRSLRQTQRGDNAYQAAGDINIGLSATEVIEIFDRMLEPIRAELAAGQERLAERVEAFERLIVQEFATEQAAPAFRDPDFLYALRQAQIQAARTDSETDWELLSKLLAQRASALGNERARLATRRAIDVVGELDPKVIRTLTALFWLMHGPVPNATAEDLVSHLDAAMEALLADGEFASKQYWPLRDGQAAGLIVVETDKTFTSLATQLRRRMGREANSSTIPALVGATEHLKQIEPFLDGLDGVRFTAPGFAIALGYADSKMPNVPGLDLYLAVDWP